MVNKCGGILGLWLLLGVLLVAGCKSSPPPYGDTHNPERVKRGIAIVEPGWTLQRHSRGEVVWDIPQPSGAKGWHTLKNIKYGKTGVELERDMYYSGNSYTNTDADGRVEKQYETITITYDYAKERAGEDPWSCMLIDEAHGHLTIDREMANSLLWSWGIPHVEPTTMGKPRVYPILHKGYDGGVKF